MKLRDLTLGHIFEKKFGYEVGPEILSDLQQGLDRGLDRESFRDHAREVFARHKQSLGSADVAADIETAVPDIEVADVA
jgi:hypothetical protein